MPDGPGLYALKRARGREFVSKFKHRLRKEKLARKEAHVLVVDIAECHFGRRPKVGVYMALSQPWCFPSTANSDHVSIRARVDVPQVSTALLEWSCQIKKRLQRSGSIHTCTLTEAGVT